MKHLTAITILLIALAIGCKPGSNGDGNSGSNSSVNGGSSGSSSKTTTSGDPKDDIIAASKKFLALPSFTATMDGTGTTDMHMKVEYVAPDRFHISRGDGKMESIIIGKETYMNNGGTWRKLPVDLSTTIPNMRDAFTEEGLKTLSDVKFVGDDTVDGRPALQYSYSNSTPKEHTPYTSKIWIAKDSGLPVKIVVNYTGGNLKQLTTIYDTDAKVTIESPVK